MNKDKSKVWRKLRYYHNLLLLDPMPEEIIDRLVREVKMGRRLVIYTKRDDQYYITDSGVEYPFTPYCNIKVPNDFD